MAESISFFTSNSKRLQRYQTKGRYFTPTGYSSAPCQNNIKNHGSLHTLRMLDLCCVQLVPCFPRNNTYPAMPLASESLGDPVTNTTQSFNAWERRTIPGFFQIRSYDWLCFAFSCVIPTLDSGPFPAFPPPLRVDLGQRKHHGSLSTKKLHNKFICIYIY